MVPLPDNCMLYQDRLSRPVSLRDVADLRLGQSLENVLQRLGGVVRTLRTTLVNLMSFVRTLSVLRYALDAEGSVTVTHVPTGSYVTYRADGNIDTVATRHNHQRGKALLLNCDEAFDRGL